MRRSSRVVGSKQKNKNHKTLKTAIASKNEDGILSVVVEGKGRGVVTTRKYKKGEFIIEYCGELIDSKEAQKRELEYSGDSTIGCYMYYFPHENKKYCVDATFDDGTLGRLINHSVSGNCKASSVLIEGTPHLYFQASRDIPVGEELCYDYGDHSKVSRNEYPWLDLSMH